MSENIQQLFARDNLNSQMVTKGIRIFAEDSPIDGIYYIHSGKVKLLKNEEDGKEIILKIAGQNELIGHRCLFLSQTYNISAVAIESCKITFLPKQDLLAMINGEQGILLHLLKLLSEELHEADKKMSLLMRKNVGERIAEFLLLALDQYGNHEEGTNKIDLQLSRDEIASSIGTSHETVTRYITSFKSKGFIKEERNKIFVLMPDNLRQFSDSRKTDPT